MITRLLEGLGSRARIAFYRAQGMHIHGHVSLRAIEVRRRAACFTLEDGAALDKGVVLLATSDRARIHIGPRTYLNRHVMIDADALVEIGADVMIGPFCYITDSNHAHDRDTPVAQQPMISAPVKLGRDVWLGAHAMILKGVTIGDGAIIGAGAVVTRDVAAYAKAIGMPARTIGERH